MQSAVASLPLRSLVPNRIRLQITRLLLVATLPRQLDLGVTNIESILFQTLQAQLNRTCDKIAPMLY